MGLFAIKKPDMVSYEINEKGLKIQNRIYPYEKIKAFWVQKPLSDDGKEMTPALFIKSERLLVPIFSVPIEEINVNKIHNIIDIEYNKSTKKFVNLRENENYEKENNNNNYIFYQFDKYVINKFI